METIIQKNYEFEIIWREDGKKDTIIIGTTHSIQTKAFDIDGFNKTVENRLKQILIEFGKDEDHEFVLTNTIFNQEEEIINYIYKCEEINILINEKSVFQVIFQKVCVLYLRYLMEMEIARSILRFAQLGGKKAEQMLKESSFPIDIIFDGKQLVTMGLVVLNEEEIEEEIDKDDLVNDK